MADILTNSGLLLLAYALGCVSTGYYVVRHRLGSDVRDVGSGNSGATNVGRLLGTKGFVATFAGDFIKGLLVVALAKSAGCRDPWCGMFLLAVVAGHVWPVQLGFKGGKGVAPAFGGMLVYDPVVTLALLAPFLLLWRVTGQRDIAGAGTFLCLPLVAFLTGRPSASMVTGLALTSLLLWTHRVNLAAMGARPGRGDR